VFDFEEGRIHIGRVYKPTGGTLNFKGNQDCKRFLADGTIAENVFKGKNDQVEAFARLQQTKFCEILPFEWDHNEVLEKKKVEVAPPTPGATKEEEKEEDDYLANADETDED
jgi:hypothetical protein